jgi:hypothetical protein
VLVGQAQAQQVGMTREFETSEVVRWFDRGAESGGMAEAGVPCKVPWAIAYRTVDKSPRARNKQCKQAMLTQHSNKTMWRSKKLARRDNQNYVEINSISWGRGRGRNVA